MLSSLVGEGSLAMIGSPAPIIGRLKISSSSQSSTKGRVDFVFNEFNPFPTFKINTRRVLARMFSDARKRNEHINKVL